MATAVLKIISPDLASPHRVAERLCVLLISHSQAATIALLAAHPHSVYLVLEGEGSGGVWETVGLVFLSLLMTCATFLHSHPIEYATFYGDRLLTDPAILVE